MSLLLGIPVWYNVADILVSSFDGLAVETLALWFTVSCEILADWADAEEADEAVVGYDTAADESGVVIDDILGEERR